MKKLLPLLFILLWATTAHSATVTCTLGPDSDSCPSGANSCDYTDINDWADDYGSSADGCTADCSASDTCVLEVYGTAVQSTEVFIDDPGFEVNAVIKPASGEEHTGQAGTGAEISVTHSASADVFELNRTARTMTFVMQFMEIDVNGNDVDYIFNVANMDFKLENSILHGTSGSSQNMGVILTSSPNEAHIHNTVFYDLNRTGGNLNAILVYPGNPVVVELLNNTITDIQTTSSGTARGVFTNTEAASHVFKNNLCSDIVGATADVCWFDNNFTTSTAEKNACDDTTCSSTGTNYDSETISYAGGSPLDWSLGCSDVECPNARDNGEDLCSVACSENENLDLENFDRDSGAYNWSIGAVNLDQGGVTTTTTTTTITTTTTTTSTTTTTGPSTTTTSTTTTTTTLPFRFQLFK